MPTITYIEHNGATHEIQAEVGITLMQAAVDNLVPGILGDCGGSCTCATCRAYIESPWDSRLTAPSEDERMMLEGVVDASPQSRLCCQIKLVAEWDGIVVKMPPSQG